MTTDREHTAVLCAKCTATGAEGRDATHGASCQSVWPVAGEQHFSHCQLDPCVTSRPVKGRVRSFPSGRSSPAPAPAQHPKSPHSSDELLNVGSRAPLTGPQRDHGGGGSSQGPRPCAGRAPKKRTCGPAQDVEKQPECTSWDSELSRWKEIFLHIWRLRICGTALVFR